MRNYVKNAIGISEEDDLTMNQIIEKMQIHFRNKSNIAVARVSFNKIKQNTGESFDHFYVRLKKSAEDAEICTHCIEQ